MDRTQLLSPQKFAAEIRIACIQMIQKVGKGHIGGSMSIADAMAVLYGYAMQVDPQNPQDPKRDQLVLSKGHAGPALYAALALKRFFPMEWLDTMNQFGSPLPSHTNALLTPGVDISTGSLGQGLSVAVGLALADLMDRRPCHTYCILGDGECQEGQVWEAAMLAGNRKCGRLIVLLDENGFQCSNPTAYANNPGDLGAKFGLFGFQVETVDGHNIAAIVQAVENAKVLGEKPHLIVLKTIKGYGCSFAQGMANNHCIGVSEEQMEEAVAILNRNTR